MKHNISPEVEKMTDYSALAYSLPENVMMYKYSGRTEDELR